MNKNDLQSTSVKFSPIKLEHVEENQRLKIKKFKIENRPLDSPENFTSLIGKTIGNHAVKAYQQQNQHTKK